VLTIGEFSKLARTTIKTLRHYDEEGLLKPAAIDEWTGYRYYTTAQLYPLQRVIALRQAGLSVEEVRRILAGADEMDVLRGRREAVLRDLEEAGACVRRLDILMRSLKGGETMIQPILRMLPGCTVFFKDGVIQSFAEFSEFIPAAEAEFRAANPDLGQGTPGYCFVSYLDGEYREENIHIRYSQAVARPGVETQSIRFARIEPVEAVCVVHRGPYDSLGKTYAAAISWAQQNGYETMELPRECYIDGIWNKDDPADWLTEIELPVRKR
jgi:DNA-binding transcriptional MerR regulator/effector-binding domain-containing protein